MLATENVICITQRRWPLKVLDNISIGCLESLVRVLFLFLIFFPLSHSHSLNYFLFVNCNSKYKIMNQDFSQEIAN